MQENESLEARIKSLEKELNKTLDNVETCN